MGKFDDTVELAKSLPAPVKGQRATPSRAGVNEALGSVTSALAESPALVTSGKYADSIQKAKDIAAGKKDTSGGIGGLFGATIGKGLEGVGYVLGLPARTVTSIGKETVDLFQGEGFNVKELVTQPFQSDFYVSKFIPKTGNKWLDIAVGLGADILTDPLTWVAPTAVMGRSQRIALASKAGELVNLGKAPTLANKLDDIVRYGEWALDDVERELLNIPKGLRWQFGKNTPVFDPSGALGKASGMAAQAVGKPFASVRATIGDIPALNRVQGFVRPRSYGGALNQLGRRGQLDGVDILKEVSRYSAGIRFRAQRGLTEQMLLADNQALLKELDNSPFRNTVSEVIEGTADRTGRVVSTQERELADRIVNLFQGARDEANKFTREFATKRGVDADYVGFIDNYFHASLTDEARNFVSGRNFGKGKYDSELAKTLDILPMEFVSGPTILRGRTLKKDEKWLGQVLEFGDKAEINRIARDELGFDWFKTDARSVVSDYIDNVGKQTGRIAFIDRLFDYGTDVVDKVLPKMVPDGELIAGAKKSYRSLNSAYNRIANSIDNFERILTGVVSKATGRAERAAAKGTEAGVVLREDITGLAKDVADARKALTQARSKATRKSKEIRAAFDNAVAPLETRIMELENILKAGADREELAATVLKDLHVRAFPDMDDALRPTKYADLARDIKAGAKDAYKKRMDELATAKETGADIGRRAGAAKGQLTKTTNAADNALAEIRAAKESVKGIKGKKGELPQVKAELSRQKRVMEKAIKDDPVVKNVKSAEQAHVRAVNAVKKAEALLVDRQTWETTVKPQLDDVVNSVKAGVSGRNFAKGLVGNDREAAQIITRQWIENTENALNQLESLKILTPEERDVWQRTLTSMRASEVDLAKVAGDKNYANAIINALSDPADPLYPRMVNDVKEGWAAMERLGVQLPAETKAMLFNGIEKFGKIDEVRQFLKIFDRYNQFFRVTAMLNPGFVVRNAYTAAFNNFVYGVTLADTNDAIKFATNLHRKGARVALDALPDAEREVFERAYKGVMASGAGQIRDISSMPITDGITGKLLNSRLVKVWGTANSDAEVGARMAMALRAARNGDNIDQIATTVARYHFDYSDLSKLDEIAKVFVPFWTFASRNIPLQIMNQIARPSMYRAYESAKRNMPVDEGMILPSWLAEREPLGFGAGGVLNPDLPQVDMMSQVRNLSDPLRLLAQLYPQYRLPIELAGNRQLNLDIPFSDKPEMIEGPLDLPALLAGLLTGQTVDTAGGPAVTAKTSYAVTSALPTLGVLQRLLPQGGGDDKYKERQLSSVLGTLTGAPYRQVTQTEQENELIRRQFALRDFLDSLQRRGYVE